MTPVEALEAQILKNEQILVVVKADGVSGITNEGKQHKVREISDINAGLREALSELRRDPPRQR